MSDDSEIPELWIVPWISRRARPVGVRRREGRGLMRTVDERGDVRCAGGYSGIDGIV